MLDICFWDDGFCSDWSNDLQSVIKTMFGIANSMSIKSSVALKRDTASAFKFEADLPVGIARDMNLPFVWYITTPAPPFFMASSAEPSVKT